MTHDEHVEVLGNRVDGMRQRRIGRCRKNVRLTCRHDDVRCVPAAGAFRMEHVDPASGDRIQSVLYVTGFVEAVGVQRYLKAELVGCAQSGVDRGRSGTPVLVNLESACARESFLAHGLMADGAALAEKKDVERDVVEGAVHHRQRPGAGRDGGCLASFGWARSAARHGRRTSGECFHHLDFTEEVHVSVDRTRGEDLSLTGDHVGARPDEQLGVHAIHDVGVTGLADRNDASVANSDVCPDDSPVIENHRVGDDDVESALVASGQALAHRLADALTAAEDHLVAGRGVVVLDLDPQICVGQTDLVACGRAVQGGVAASIDPAHSAVLSTVVAASSGESASTGTSLTRTFTEDARKGSSTSTPGVPNGMTVLGSRACVGRSSSGTICRPGTLLSPPSAISVTVLLTPGSNRTDVPEGMSSRKPSAASRSKVNAGLAAGRWRCEPI
eukprot:gene25427-biopygen21942